MICIWSFRIYFTDLHFTARGCHVARTEIANWLNASFSFDPFSREKVSQESLAALAKDVENATGTHRETG